MKIHTKKHKKISLTRLLIFFAFTFYAVSLIYPLVWAFLSSLKEATEYMTNNKMDLPKDWLFTNYLKAFEGLNIDGKDMFDMFFNSIWFTLGGTLAGVGVSCMTAYAVAKYRFPGSKLIYWTAVISMMIPIVGSLPSQFKIYTALGIIESPLLLLAFLNGFGFNFLVLHSYFESLPRSYMEAAFIDGASHFQCFWRVMLPQAKSPIMALSLVSAINFWNDYNTPLLFLKEYPTLSSGIYMYQVINTRILNMPILFAGILLTAVPVLILYAFFSNKIMNISLEGGIKG
ncbi:MAG: carbohydrate ABC transporter permease [Clostridia bacterium]|nr:carbohydrate ABC transporter permease [Clostridia bacterium]